MQIVMYGVLLFGNEIYGNGFKYVNSYDEVALTIFLYYFVKRK